MRLTRSLRLLALAGLAFACANPVATASPPASAPTPTARAPVPVQPIASLPSGTQGFPWWNDTVFYQIFVRSFYDSDGDGIGDFNGLSARLDYLNDGDLNTTTDLGVTGLWLMPIHPSPSYHGYDVTDYYAVNPQYGTLDDFKRLLAEAHKRGIRVIIDWVLNHTSSQHPWFQAAQNPASPFYDWYVWSKTPGGSPGWHPSQNGQFYYGFFWSEMPDLNYTNPSVIKEMERATQFWLKEVGVDGFRLDAAKYLIENVAIQNTVETHALYERFRPFYKGVNPQAMMIGEIWDSSGLVADYVQGDELDLAFDFKLAEAIIISARVEKAETVSDVLTADLELFQPGQFATFSANHDQNRVRSQVFGDLNRARSVAGLLLTAPGVPFIYYGEEIGMAGRKPDEQIRTPMQWSAEKQAGFTTGQPWISVNPDFETINAANQVSDPNALLSLYRSLIHLRNQHVALRLGEFARVSSDHAAVFASLRFTEAEIILVVINLGQQPVQDYALTLATGPLKEAQTYPLVPLLAAGHSAAPLAANAQGGFDGYQPVPELPPYSTFIFQLQPGP